MYLKNKLNLTENVATEVYTSFSMLIYFMGIFGGILSDVYFGKFRTILALSVVYAIGSIIVAISAIPTIIISPAAALYTGLLLIAIGSGGIKPCVSAFGGDQFVLPEQNAKITSFFSLFYFAISASALLSTTIIPNIRAHVHCFGENECYPLAFGVPAILMIMAISRNIEDKEKKNYF